MVQRILGTGTPRKPSFAQRLNVGVGAGLDMASKMYKEHQENEAIERELGSGAKGLPRDFQQQMLKGKIEQDIHAKKLAGESPEETKRYNTIKNQFGEKAAELYRAAPEGGKTQLIQHYIEASQRGLNVEEMLNQHLPQAEPQKAPMNENLEELEAPSMKTIDYDKGLTPKERAKRQDTRYSINLPLYQESQRKVNSLESEKDHIDILKELSPQISTAERFNINPQSGELLFPAAASAEAQQFVKTINDFTIQAKDSYGSRVTNFDLTQFMKRLPTLANSAEGRELIFDQMETINAINMAREKAIQRVIDEHGGIRNIDYDAAERIADKESKKEITELKKRFTKNKSTLEKQYNSKVEEKKKIIPKGYVGIQTAGGQTGYIKKEEVEEFLKEPGNSLL